MRDIVYLRSLVIGRKEKRKQVWFFWNNGAWTHEQMLLRSGAHQEVLGR
jgi:hypothetical protein